MGATVSDEGPPLSSPRALRPWLVASYAAQCAGAGQAALMAAVSCTPQRGLDRSLDVWVRVLVDRADPPIPAARGWLPARARAVAATPGAPGNNRWIWWALLLAYETAVDVTANVLKACGSGATRRGNPPDRLHPDARCGSLRLAIREVCAGWLGLVALRRNPDREVDGARW